VRDVRQFVTSEKLAYWYFRLNGFLTMENFILHSDSRKGSSQRTDADIYGVRFPFRQEMNMPDDIRFQKESGKPLFIIAEVKGGECKLNGPWTDPLKQNMQYVLRAIGAFEPSELEQVARFLYETYVYEDQSRKIQLLAIGSRQNEEYARERPNLSQLLFVDMLNFIYERFHEFRMQKRDHKQWDSVGRYLYDQTEHGRAKFVSNVLEEAGLLRAQ
jgi:hypothetical protein